MSVAPASSHGLRVVDVGWIAVRDAASLASPLMCCQPWALVGLPRDAVFLRPGPMALLCGEVQVRLAFVVEGYVLGVWLGGLFFLGGWGVVTALTA